MIKNNKRSVKTVRKTIKFDPKRWEICNECNNFGFPINSDVPACELCEEDDFFGFLDMLDRFKTMFNIKKQIGIVISPDIKLEEKRQPENVETAFLVSIGETTSGEEPIVLIIPDWSGTKEYLIKMGTLVTMAHEYAHILRGDPYKKTPYIHGELHNDAFFEEFMKLLSHSIRKQSDEVTALYEKGGTE